MNKNKPNILYVTTKWLLPIEDGSRVATKAILQPLLKLNPEISHLALAGADEKIDQNELKKIFPVKEIYIIKRAAHRTGGLKYLDFLWAFLRNPFFPISFYRYQLEAKVEPILKNQKFDLIILDGLHSAVPFLKINSPALILRAQNVEQNLWRNSARLTHNPLKKYFFNYQAFLVEKLERKVLEKAEKSFAISDEDQAEFSLQTSKKIFQLPVGLNFNDPLPPHQSSKLELLFLGKLDWEPNSQGLKWFLELVWPHLTPNRYHLTIAGSGDHSWLSQPTNSNITFLGRVPEVKPIYEKAQLVIIPIFIGSGTRIKVLEASRFMRSCVSTKAGIEGSPLSEKGETYFSADSAQDWISTLESISIEEVNQKAKLAFEICAESLEENKVAQKFYQELVN